MFNYVLKIPQKNHYNIQTRYEVLDYTHSTSELMSLLNIISLNISDSSLIKRVSLHAVSAKKSAVKKTAVKCGYKD